MVCACLFSYVVQKLNTGVTLRMDTTITPTNAEDFILSV